MPELPTCICVRGLPPYDRLTAIYQAAAELSGDTSLPDASCVSGVPPFARFAYIYAAFRVLADDSSLPSMECVEGEPPSDQVARIYQAARIYSGDSSFLTYRCVRGMPIWQQWREIYRALYLSAGSPDGFTHPNCSTIAGLDVLSDVFCITLVQDNPPELLFAEISADGLHLVLTFNQAVELFSPDSISLNGTSAGPEDISGSGTSVIVIDLSDPVNPSDVVTMNYAPTNEFNTVFSESGDPMEGFVNFPVQNNSGKLTYVQPDGLAYFQPDGVSLYLQP